MENLQLNWLGPADMSAITPESRNRCKKIVFAKDKRIATKIFMDYLRAADRAARRQGGNENVN